MRVPDHRLSVRLLTVAAMIATPLLVPPPAAATAVPARAAALAPEAATPAAPAGTTTKQARTKRTSTKRARTVATTKRGRSAVRWAQNRSRWPARTCMVFVRTALRVGPRYGTPRVAWAAARSRHRGKYAAIPAGVPVYTAGRTAPGHIVLSLGNGKVRSTDWPRVGRVGTVRLATLLRSWNHRYLGWSEDLNGVRVWRR